MAGCPGRSGTAKLAHRQGRIKMLRKSHGPPGRGKRKRKTGAQKTEKEAGARHKGEGQYQRLREIKHGQANHCPDKGKWREASDVHSIRNINVQKLSKLKKYCSTVE